MPFQRPTFSQLSTQASQDLISSNPNGSSQGLLRFSVLGIIGQVIAKMAHGLWGYLDYIARQAIPVTATDENLAAWAALKGVVRTPASSATGSATFTGTPGVLLPAATLIRRTSDAYAYLTVADAFADATGVISVTITDAASGSAGNAPAGIGLSLAGAVAGVLPTGVATSPITGGGDVESDASLRTRMLAAYSAPAQGGALSDYAVWTEAVAGITRVWVNPNGFGAGSVVIYVMLDASEASNGGFPVGSNGVASDEPRATTATGDQLRVANALSPLRPVTALVYVASPIAYPVNVTLANLSGASSTARAAISAALTNLLLNVADPLGGEVFPSQIDAAIAGTGATAYSLVSPSQLISAPVGYLPILGTVTYQ